MGVVKFIRTIRRGWVAYEIGLFETLNLCPACLASNNVNYINVLSAALCSVDLRFVHKTFLRFLRSGVGGTQLLRFGEVFHVYSFQG